MQCKLLYSIAYEHHNYLFAYKKHVGDEVHLNL